LETDNSVTQKAKQGATMNCPKCYEPLRISDRQGIEIDYCPDCRGVWLDRGELDKIIERTIKFDMQSSSYEDRPRYDTPQDPKKYSGDKYDKHYKKKYHKKKKTKHMLEDLFDIFD
jgi:Zn-finger nucleic acid-binding protein